MADRAHPVDLRIPGDDTAWPTRDVRRARAHALAVIDEHPAGTVVTVALGTAARFEQVLAAGDGFRRLDVSHRRDLDVQRSLVLALAQQSHRKGKEPQDYEHARNRPSEHAQRFHRNPPPALIDDAGPLPCAVGNARRCATLRALRQLSRLRRYKRTRLNYDVRYLMECGAARRSPAAWYRFGAGMGDVSPGDCRVMQLYPPGSEPARTAACTSARRQSVGECAITAAGGAFLASSRRRGRRHDSGSRVIHGAAPRAASAEFRAQRTRCGATTWPPGQACPSRNRTARRDRSASSIAWASSFPCCCEADLWPFNPSR